MNPTALRPLRLQRGFVLRSTVLGLLGALGGLAITALYLGWQAYAAGDILHDNEVWDATTVTVPAHVSGTERSHNFILHDYDVDVSYTDQAGGRHESKASFATLFGGVDQSLAPTVRYAAGVPSDFALSWAVETSASRWAAFAFLAGVGALIGGCVVFLGARTLLQLRDARRIAAAPALRLGRVGSVTEQLYNGRRTGNFTWRYELAPDPLVTAGESPGGYRVAAPAPPGARRRAHSVAFNAKRGAPFFADAARHQLAVLTSVAAPARPLVLRHDLYPLELSAAESAELRAKIAALVA